MTTTAGPRQRVRLVARAAAAARVMSLAELCWWLAAAGWTQARIARHVGWSRSMVARRLAARRGGAVSAR